MKKSCHYLLWFWVFGAGLSCNAQTLSVPSPEIAVYEQLINLSNTSVFSLQNTLEDFKSKDIEKVSSVALSPKTKEGLLKVSSISPTHYAETHNAFFCRLERKINKKFVMPVRIRLEGF
ncbi:MAG: hypothetical protein ACPGVB_12035 [Chitinophagales bacterium]